LVAIFLLPLLTKTFTPAQYGFIELVSVTILIISSLSGFNLDSSILRFFHEENAERKKIIISTIIIGSTLSSAIFSVLLIASLRYLPACLFTLSDSMSPLYIALISMPFMVFVTNILAVLMIQQKSVQYTFFSLFKVISVFILTFILIKVYDFGIAGVFLANLIVYVILSVVGMFYLVYRNFFRFVFSLVDFKKILFYSSPLILSSLSWILLGNINKYFLRFLDGPESVGIYSVGLEICMVLGVLGAAFRQAWIPYAFSITKDSDNASIYSGMFKKFITVFFIAAIMIAVFAKPAILILSSQKYLPASLIMGYMAVGILFVNLSGSFFNLGVLIKKKTGLSAVAYFLGVVVNVALNLLLIPRYSILGATLALLFGYLVTAGLLLYFSNRVYKISYDLKLLFYLLILYLAFIFTWNRLFN